MSGNEASAIGALRAINKAQNDYGQKCNGYAADLTELRRAGDFLSSELSAASLVTKDGYEIGLEPLAGASVISDPPIGCTGTVNNFFAYARPAVPGSTGTRYFATDANGTIFQSQVPLSNPVGPDGIPLQ